MDSDNNRQWILSTALELFSKKGYDGVGMAEICAEAEVSKPTVYYYFQSKKGLFEAILNDYGEVMCDELRKATLTERDFIKNLTDLLKAQIKYAKENPEFFRLYMNLDCNAYDDDFEVFETLSSLRFGVESVYTELFEKSSATFGNMRGHEELFSNIYKSIVESTTKQILNDHLEATEENIFKIVKCFVYGCAN